MVHVVVLLVVVIQFINIEPFINQMQCCTKNKRNRPEKVFTFIDYPIVIVEVIKSLSAVVGHKVHFIF